MFQNKYEIIKKKMLSYDIVDFTVKSKEISNAATAGQFVHISAPGFFLRRPISICEIGKADGTLRIVFQVRGKGTDSLSKLNEGEKMDILGPLGHGFTTNDRLNSVILIGGGIGTPPMLELAKFYGDKARVITGFKTKELSILSGDFKNAGAQLFECTDDGSLGRKGFVTDELREQIQIKKPDMVFACGPVVMLKGVKQICEEHGILCEISLEERMACGVGACLGCAVKLDKGEGEFYGHVCKDGPVFSSKEVVL